MTTDIFFDGSCEPKNPGGIAAYGWLIVQDGVTLATGKGIATQGKEATNNLAEYSALIAGLQAARELGITDEIMTVRGDSQLVIKQMTGEWGCNAPNLKPLHRQALELVLSLDYMTFQWIPRQENQAADSLSREAYQEYRNRFA